MDGFSRSRPPDVARWAKVIAALLRPGGRFFIREGHPAMPDMVAGEDREYRLPERPDRMPLSYTLQAVKTA